ncbi:polysaccharide pyruvyl transferase family protein [Pseudarthrobacter sp. SL88]|uniref:polysaccharide pyruvyl transferase family protein n=1 Tax=Pseudarthrobacter sp. SL88 TaxID=2994666 RepID=UPI0022769B41|nr:polysaccharide pyruvyl transferase family protein [Pseudarthrobacter sp. SL88]MCY1673811.1 polysaccharide pyruvyl transferase family protein [Pseudarthrobacter sp. SL88]
MKNNNKREDSILTVKRVLVLWADESSSNLGVRVLAEGAESLARRAWGDDIEVDFQSFGTGPLGTQLSGKVVLKGLLSGSKRLRAEMAGYDVVIDTGAGDSFTDIYGLKRLTIMTYTRFVAKLSSLPVIFAPQTIGPFKTVLGRQMARHSLRASHSVMARDSTSNEFASGLGFPADCLATDVAFALYQPELESGFPKADVVLNISGLLWNSDAHLPREKYRDLSRELIERLLRCGRKVTLLAHVLDNPSIDNDASVIQDLASEFCGRVDVYTPGDLEQVRKFIASSNIVIGARMHACLNALSVGVPAIPLAYSRKFAPLLADIGWPYTIDLRNDSEVVDKVVELVERGQLREQAGLVRQQAEARLHTAAEHLSHQVAV